ncbi:MAG: CpaF family protein [Acidimicrobiales bacterium]
MSTRELSPLQEIERRVQRRAKDISLDMAGADGRAKLRALIDDEVGTWSGDFKRGLRSYDLADPELVAERAWRNLAGYGPLEPLLGDDDVWEIMVNAPDAIFVKRHHGPSSYHDEVFNDDDHVVRTLTKILDDAAASHRRLDPAEGLQDAQLDTGARLHIVHGDVGRDGHVLVNIRKFTGVAYRSLAELVEHDMFDLRVAELLRACVRARLSMVFSGAPGSGKTTMLSCCAAELDPSLRVVIAEEVFEADLPLPNVASMQTRPGRPDRKEVDLRRLVAGFLRMAPDIAVVGEVRDREALPLLLTLSSGVKGFTTIHAGSARQALTRLRFICQLADTPNELSMSALSSLVSEAVDIVVHCARLGGKVRVSEVIAVEELQTGSDGTQFTVTELFQRPRWDEPLAWTGNVPVRAARFLEEAGYDVRALLDPRADGAVAPHRVSRADGPGRVSRADGPGRVSGADGSRVPATRRRPRRAAGADS